MSHFAKVLNGKVIQVIAANSDFFESFVDSSPGTWLETSYNTYGGKHSKNGEPVRANYAGIGYIYDAVNDVFYALQPYPSWTIAAPTWLWEAPVPYPNDEKTYIWDEENLSWVEQNV